MFPASMEVAPYSPIALAKVRMVPDRIPGPAAGTATFQKISGQCPYQSPTDMGVNMVGNCITDDQEISTSPIPSVLAA